MPTRKTVYGRVGVEVAYLGLYLAVEQVEGFVTEWFPDSDGVLVHADRPDRPGMGASYLHSSLEWEGEYLATCRRLYEVKTRGLEDAGLVAIREAARRGRACRRSGSLRRGLPGGSFPRAGTSIVPYGIAPPTTCSSTARHSTRVLQTAFTRPSHSSVMVLGQLTPVAASTGR